MLSQQRYQLIPWGPLSWDEHSELRCLKTKKLGIFTPIESNELDIEEKREMVRSWKKVLFLAEGKFPERDPAVS